MIGLIKWILVATLVVRTGFSQETLSSCVKQEGDYVSLKNCKETVQLVLGFTEFKDLNYDLVNSEEEACKGTLEFHFQSNSAANLQLHRVGGVLHGILRLPGNIEYSLEVPKKDIGSFIMKKGLITINVPKGSNNSEETFPLFYAPSYEELADFDLVRVGIVFPADGCNLEVRILDTLLITNSDDLNKIPKKNSDDDKEWHYASVVFAILDGFLLGATLGLCIACCLLKKSKGSKKEGKNSKQTKDKKKNKEDSYEEVDMARTKDEEKGVVVQKGPSDTGSST